MKVSDIKLEDLTPEKMTEITRFRTEFNAAKDYKDFANAISPYRREDENND